MIVISIQLKHDIEKLVKYKDLSVISKTTDDWYCLLRDTQWSLIKTLEAGYVDSEYHFSKQDSNPINTDLFTEYIYIADLDNERLIIHGLTRDNSVKYFPFS